MTSGNFKETEEDYVCDQLVVNQTAKKSRTTMVPCTRNRKRLRECEKRHQRTKRTLSRMKERSFEIKMTNNEFGTNIGVDNGKDIPKKTSYGEKRTLCGSGLKSVDYKKNKVLKHILEIWLIFKIVDLLVKRKPFLTPILNDKIKKVLCVRLDELQTLPQLEDKRCQFKDVKIHDCSEITMNDCPSIKLSKGSQCTVDEEEQMARKPDPSVRHCGFASNDLPSESKSPTEIRRRCTAVNDMIDLKTQHQCKKISYYVLKDDKKSVTKKDVLKDVINGHLAECVIGANVTAAPVFKKGNISGNENERQNHENKNETGEGLALDQVTNPVRNEVSGEELLGACSTNARERQSESFRAKDPSISKIQRQSLITMDGEAPTEIIRTLTSPHCNSNSPPKDTFKSPLCTPASTTPATSQTRISNKVTKGDKASYQISDKSSQPTNLPEPEVDQAEIQSFVPLMEIIDKIAVGERVPPQITMRYEMLRFCTLRSFPKHNKPYITRIAAAGFYFANTDDEVVCYCCARRRRNWREDDNPMEIHRELNPNCSFLLRNSEVNVSVRMSEMPQNSARNTLSRTRQSTNNRDMPSTCDTISSNTSTSTRQSDFATSNSSQNSTPAISSPVTPSSLPVDSTNSSLLLNQTRQKAHGNFVQTITPSSRSQQPQSNHMTVSNNYHDTPVASSNSAMSTSQLLAAGTASSTAPKYPKYAMKPVRLTSFNDCGDIVILPENLATAGFFYAGFGDCVRCFQCGVGLRHWSDEDDPWIEHCRWSKDCLFVKEVKGQEFVNLVQMAVQYSQNQNGNGQIPNGNTTGTGTETSEDAAIEQQMHSNAAQSVLEMGYNPNVIRNAIRVLSNANVGQTLSASTLMEKIFELEDEASNSSENDQLAQGTPLNRPNTISAQNTESNNTQRTSLDRSLPSSNYVSAQSVAVGDTSSTAASLASGTQGTTRTQNKKSQLLEQKKLKEENEQLKQQSMCTKCKNNDVCIVFLPCGHLVTCETCAPSVRYCSVQDCGKYIKGTVRTYLS